MNRFLVCMIKFHTFAVRIEKNSGYTYETQ